MIQKIKCYFGFHNYGNWEHIGIVNKYQEKLKRRCSCCGKLHYYTGLTQRDIETDAVSPYIFKD